MAIERIFVELHELSSVAAEIARAAEIYEEAVEEARETADDLASKWEGAARDAFVAHQAQVYQWHKMMLEIIRDIVDLISNLLAKYNEMEINVKNLVNG